MALNVVKPSKYIDEKLLQRACEEVFLYLGEEFEVSIKFACENCIRGLNKQYMGKDESTNVLSFNHDDDTKDGDIVICETVVENEAVELKYEPKELSLLYVVHGMLHLSGYDHKKTEDRVKMELAERNILSKLGVKIERS